MAGSIVLIILMSLCQSVPTALTTRPCSLAHSVEMRYVGVKPGLSAMVGITIVMMAAMNLCLSVTTALGQVLPCAGTAASA